MKVLKITTEGSVDKIRQGMTHLHRDSVKFITIPSTHHLSEKIVYQRHVPATVLEITTEILERKVEDD